MKFNVTEVEFDFDEFGDGIILPKTVSLDSKMSTTFETSSSLP